MVVFDQKSKGILREYEYRSVSPDCSNYSTRPVESLISEQLHDVTQSLRAERNRTEAIRRAERVAGIAQVNSGRMQALERAMKKAGIKNTPDISELLNSNLARNIDGTKHSELNFSTDHRTANNAAPLRLSMSVGFP